MTNCICNFEPKDLKAISPNKPEEQLDNLTQKQTSQFTYLLFQGKIHLKKFPLIKNMVDTDKDK